MKTLVKEKKGKDFPYYMSKNISEGGIFLVSKTPYPAGKKILLEFAVPGQRLSTTVEGEIVNQSLYEHSKGNETSCGMGIKFINPPEDLIRAIRAYVKKTRISNDTQKTNVSEGENDPEPSDTHDT